SRSGPAATGRPGRAARRVGHGGAGCLRRVRRDAFPAGRGALLLGEGRVAGHGRGGGPRAAVTVVRQGQVPSATVKWPAGDSLRVRVTKMLYRPMFSSEPLAEV